MYITVGSNDSNEIKPAKGKSNKLIVCFINKLVSCLQFVKSQKKCELAVRIYQYEF